MLSTSSYILACDIGGTHITSAIIDTQRWEIISSTLTRNHINSGAYAKSIFQEWGNNINECLYKSTGRIAHIGIAMPGPFDYEKGVSYMKNQNKYDSLYELDINIGLKKIINLPNMEIRYINDAAAFLQGEVYAQELSRSCDKILGITLGTGLGSAVWTKGSKAFDADLWDDPYKESIFEEYLVTRWFTKRFHELSGIEEKGLKEIVEKHLDTASCTQLLHEYSQHLHDFMLHFSQVHACHDFIIGGNIAKAWDLISEKNDFNAFKITRAQYAEKAALIGAASIF